MATCTAARSVLKRCPTYRCSTSSFTQCQAGHAADSGLAVRRQAELVQDSKHRPMDLRAVPAHPAEQRTQSARSHSTEGGPAWDAMLMVASAIAAEARQAVKVGSLEVSRAVQTLVCRDADLSCLHLPQHETGFRCSAGIACNKTLAKLSSGLHKPDDQTVLCPTEAEAFVAPLQLRALPGEPDSALPSCTYRATSSDA